MTDAISALAAAPRPGGAAPPIPAGRGHRNPGLDGLRVIAAFAVLLTHVGGQTGFEFTGTPMSWVANRGDIGVPDRKSTRLNSSHLARSRMPSSA